MIFLHTTTDLDVAFFCNKLETGDVKPSWSLEQVEAAGVFLGVVYEYDHDDSRTCMS